MSNVIRSIFTQLDDESLRQAELVSKVWWEVISEECIWKFVLRNKVSPYHCIRAFFLILINCCVVGTCNSIVEEICSF
jgi:hypothetical protein